MDENVGVAAVGDDEAVTLGDVEPFDATRDFDEPYRTGEFGTFLRSAREGRGHPRLIEFFAQSSGPLDTTRAQPPLNTCMGVDEGSDQPSFASTRRIAMQVIRRPR